MKINNLRQKLVDQIDKIEKGEIPLDSAREISRASQSIIESLRIEILYSKSVKAKGEIDFMEY